MAIRHLIVGVIVVALLIFTALYPSQILWMSSLVAVVAGALIINTGTDCVWRGGFLGGDEDETRMGGSRRRSDPSMAKLRSSYDDNIDSEPDMIDFMGGAKRHTPNKPFTINLKEDMYKYLKSGEKTCEIRRGEESNWLGHKDHIIVFKCSGSPDKQNVVITGVKHFDTLEDALKDKLSNNLGPKGALSDIKNSITEYYNPETTASAGGVNIITFELTDKAAPNFTWGS